MPKTLVFVVNHAGYFLTHRLPLAVAAKAEGYDVHILTPRSRHVPLIEEAGLSWREIRLERSGRNPLQELRTVRDLVRAYRDLRPDVVHHVTAKPVLWGTLAARIAGVPAVVNAIAGLGHVFISRGLAARIMRLGLTIGYRLVLRHRRMRVIFQNDDDRSLFVRNGWLREAQTVLIAGSGVDPAVFTPGEKESTDRPVVVFPSRMLRSKGLPEFIEAVQLLNDRGIRARYQLVGDADPDNPASVTEEELRRWGTIEGVDYQGRRTDMPEVFAAADIACLPSHREGMPKALLEAASCALPIVTTDVPGCRHVVRHGENGLLVPLQDAPAIAAALEQLITNPQLRRTMGARGRERVLREFSLQAVVAATLRLYAELTA